MGEIFRRPQPPVPMPFTGERLTSELSGQTEIEHLHRYLLARQLCRGKHVIDVASGEGYGSALLAQTAASVTGIEIAADAVAHAAASYRYANLRFLQGDARAMSVADASTDVIVSFETIEHFAEQEKFLSEIRRVLRPGGSLIVSTPDQDNYSPADTPANPFHVLELTQEDFAELLGRYFSHVRFLRQRVAIGSLMVPSPPAGTDASPLSFERRGDHLECSAGLPRPQYIVAIASDQPIEQLPPSIYIETSHVGFLRGTDAEHDDRTREVERLCQQLEEKQAAYDEAVAAITSKNETAEARIVELQRTVEAAHAERAAAFAQIADLQRTLEAARAGNAALERACERAEEAGLATRQQLAEFRERASLQEGRVAELLASSSWRITAPLRAVFGPLRRR